MRPLEPFEMERAVEVARANAAYLADCFAATASHFSKGTPKRVLRRYADSCKGFAAALLSDEPLPDFNADDEEGKCAVFIRDLRWHLNDKYGSWAAFEAPREHERLADPEKCYGFLSNTQYARSHFQSEDGGATEAANRCMKAVSHIEALLAQSPTKHTASQNN